MIKSQSTLLCISTSYPLDEGDLSGPFVKRLNELFLDSDLLQVSKIIVLCFDRRSALVPVIEQRSLEQILPLSELENLPETLALQTEVVVIPIPSFGQSLRIGAPDSLSHSPLRSSFGLAVNMYRLWKAYQRVQTCLKRQGIRAIVLAHWVLPSALIARNDQPIIYCHGGDVALLERVPFSRFLAKYLFEKTQVIICVSADLQKRIERLYPFDLQQKDSRLLAKSKHEPFIKVMPMGIDKPNPCPNYKAILQAQTSDLIVISTVGRLVPIKGYDLLLKALTILPEDIRKQMVWFMAGDGPERANLVNTARSHSLNFIDLGQLNPSQRDALLAISDLFVAPSRQVGTRVEGTPLALREAALSACSIMASDLGGVASLLDQLPSAVIYRVQATPQSIAKALTKFIIEYDVHDLSRQASLTQMKEQASQFWTWEALGKAHIQTLVNHISLITG